MFLKIIHKSEASYVLLSEKKLNWIDWKFF